MAKPVNYRAPGAVTPLPVPSALVQRRTVLAVSLLLFLLAFVLFANDVWAIALHVLLTDGAVAILWLLSAAGIGSLVPMPSKGHATAEYRTDDEAADLRSGGISPSGVLHASLRRVSAVAMGLGVISLVTLGLGLAGLLNRATAWGVIAVGLASLGLRVARVYDRAAFERRSQAFLLDDARHAWLWLPAVVTLALACAAAMALPGVLWNMFGDPHGYDVVEYHLQIPREWFEAGRIVPLHHNAFSFFPFNVEMHYLLAMHLKGGPWAGMYLAQLMHVGFVSLTVCAVAAVARALGARPAAAAVAGLAAASTPWLLLLAPIAYNEGGLLLFGTLALGWAMVAIRAYGVTNADAPEGVAGGGVALQGNALPPFALAGSFAGFACGAKLTGVPIVLLAIAGVSVVILVLRRVSVVRALGGPIVFGLAGLLTFSPWLIRNLVWAGNPVFPEAASLLGQGHFTDAQVERWSRAHAARPDQKPVFARVSAAAREIVLDWRYGWVVLPACLAVGATRSRRSLVGIAAVAFGVLGVQLVFWLAFTHLQSRFFVMAVPVAAVLAAAAPQRGWWPWVAVVLMTGVSATTWVRAGAAMQGKVFVVEKPADLAALASTGDESLAQQILAARTVTLVGDAKAFWYPTPVEGLRYRTVFDVAEGGVSNVVDAWVGARGKSTADGELIIIDAGELDRFAKTYAGIPPLRPEDEAGRGDVVVRP